MLLLMGLGLCWLDYIHLTGNSQLYTYTIEPCARDGITNRNETSQYVSGEIVANETPKPIISNINQKEYVYRSVVKM